MKVTLKSSWTDPVFGKTYPNGTVLEIDDRNFNPAYHEEVKKKTTTKSKK